MYKLKSQILFTGIHHRTIIYLQLNKQMSVAVFDIQYFMNLTRTDVHRVTKNVCHFYLKLNVKNQVMYILMTVLIHRIY